MTYEYNIMKKTMFHTCDLIPTLTSIKDTEYGQEGKKLWRGSWKCIQHSKYRPAVPISVTGYRCLPPFIDVYFLPQFRCLLSLYALYELFDDARYCTRRCTAYHMEVRRGSRMTLVVLVIATSRWVRHYLLIARSFVASPFDSLFLNRSSVGRCIEVEVEVASYLSAIGLQSFATAFFTIVHP